MHHAPKRERSSAATAKIFWSGRSQAVRLPKEFRLPGRQARIYRQGRRIVLEPGETDVDKNGWPRGFWAIFGAVGEDFHVGDRAAEPERAAPLGQAPSRPRHRKRRREEPRS
jgi:antitoxin VapB